jgi:YD repeat-containing protein
LVGTPNVSFTYDDFGRTSTVNNGIEETIYGPSSTNGYDDDDNPLNVEEAFYTPGGTTIETSYNLSYSYYPNNSRETMNVGTNTFTYDYDAAGRETCVTIKPREEVTHLAA